MIRFLVAATTFGVFFPHIWSLLVTLRGLPLIRAIQLRPEFFFLPVIFAAFRLLENLGRDPQFAIAEMIYILIVALSLLAIFQHTNIRERDAVLKGLIWGSTLLTLASTFNFLDSVYLIKPWKAYPSEARIIKQGSFQALSSNAIVSRDLGYVGPGTLSVSLRLRHIDSNNRALRLPVSLVQRGSPIVQNAVCFTDIEWRTCTFAVQLKTRAHTVLWLGGWDSWQKKNSSTLEVSSLRLVYLKPPPIGQILFNSGRSSGLTFNPNAFGLTSLVCILLIALLSKVPWHLTVVYCIPSFILLLQSGSRASLAGLVLFVLILLIKSSSLKRLVGYLAPIAILVFIFLGFQAIPKYNVVLPHILNPFEESYQASRVSLYAAVIKQVGLSFLGKGNISQLLASTQKDLGLGTLGHAHSLWLQVYIVVGLLGLSILLAGFFFVEHHLNQKRLYIAQAAFFALYCISFFDYLAFYPPYYILLFGLGYLAMSPKSSALHYD